MLHQLCWLLWLAGTVLITMSWFGVVSPTVGWFGFGIALVGAVLPQLFPQADQYAYPLTQEGLPVEPSGTPVPPDMPLEPGTPLLAFSDGRWWRATVVAVKDGDVVVLNFPGWDLNWLERIPRKHLQIDPDPNRMPLRLPPEGWLDRQTQPPNPEGVRTSGSYDGVQREP